MLPILAKNNPIRMQILGRSTWRAPAWIQILSLGLVLSFPCLAQAPAIASDPYSPLPQDTGAAGLKQMLLRLQTTARLMQTTAHPDDEDGGVLTRESRGEGASVLLMTLTRGEGGQNKIGSNLFDVLGVVRTLEQLASDRYYGVEQRFSRVADFGYSKNPEETFQKWQGHDIALGDMVRVIRTFRPDVLVARFSGTERDGHGHHQASAILTKEAFRAAADPNRFPELIKEGLQPWQPKKLYIGNVCGFGALTCAPENYTVKLATGEFNPALGMTYVQFAVEGLRHQLSQGAGGWSVDAGPHFAYYKLVDSALPPTVDKDGHEKDFWDGIDTSLPGLAAGLGKEEKKAPWLRPELEDIAGKVKEASERSEKDPRRAAEPLFAVLRKLDFVVLRLEKSDFAATAKQELLAPLHEKQEQAAATLNLAMGIRMDATVASARGQQAGTPRESEALTVVSPGQTFTIVVKMHNGSKWPLWIENVSLIGPQDWITDAYKGEPGVIRPGEDYYANFGLRVPPRVQHTRPPLHRDDPERDSVYTVDEPQYEDLPFAPPRFRAQVNYSVSGHRDLQLTGPAQKPNSGERPDFVKPDVIKSSSEPSGRIVSSVVVPFLDDQGAEHTRPLAVAPVFSVSLEPAEQVIPMQSGSVTNVKVGVSCNRARTEPGMLRLQVPDGWRVEPDELLVKFQHRGEQRDFQFKVFSAGLKESKAEIRAVLTSGGSNYSEGYSLVTREDLASAYYYQPAIQRVSVVDVKVPKGLKIGYIMGAGDDIPTVLEQIGMDVTLIPAEKLASEDLSRYGTIVLGIRAYDTQKDVVANNKKLLDYVAAGGTLVVQYNTGVGDFNGGHFTPYPAQLSRGRVSVEEAAVEVLAPDDSVFHYPNQITARDFDGWVQERGLYFMGEWDGSFKPLLASHDPGEQPLKGGLLKAQYGKGTYVYTGYAFFRQLPAGVPGAIRLYVNLLSAGQERQASDLGRGAGGGR